jgi:purine-binding chemotaxis protein CheW
MTSYTNTLNTTATEVSQELLEVVVFKVSGQEYAVPIQDVQEIILCQNPTRIPNASDSVEGIINLRGKIIPVVNSHIRLGLAQSSKTPLSTASNVATVETELNSTPEEKGQLASSEDRIIILQVDNQTVGFVVDAVSEVLNLPMEDITPPPQDAHQGRFVVGVGKYQERLLIVLDSAKIMLDNTSDSLCSSVQTVAGF